MKNTVQKEASAFNGFVGLIWVLSLFAGVVVLATSSFQSFTPEDAATRGLRMFGAIALLIFAFINNRGFAALEPNHARVLTLFGCYVGSITKPGFYWYNPFYSSRALSLRAHNFNSGTLKVNDARGNPIEIGAVVVWRIIDTARAAFDVAHLDQFVALQAESAIRTLASRHPYDHADEHDDGGTTTLRGHGIQVASELKIDVQERLSMAGVEVLDAQIAHLAYSPEIAAVMLRRQQADAIISARRKIVEGAVGMVELAIRRIEASNLLVLDDARKAVMVNNLLVAVVSEREVQPTISTGQAPSLHGHV